MNRSDHPGALGGRRPFFSEATRRGGLWVVFLALCLSSPLPAEAQSSFLDFGAEWRWADFDQATGYRGGRAHEMLEVGDTLWVRGDQGIYWFDGFAWNWVGDGEGLPLGHPAALLSDESGTMVTVVGGDLFTGGTDGFSPLTHPGWDPGRYRVLRAAASPRGLVVLAEDQVEARRGIYLWDEEEIRDISPPSTTLDIARMWASGDGWVWLNSETGLLKLAEDGWRSLVEPSPARYLIPDLWESNAGQGYAFIRMPLEERGIVTWDEDLVLEKVAREGHNNVVSGTMTSDGEMVVVYESEEVRILEDGVWTSAGLPADRASGVHFVYEDSFGDLWFASSRGLHLFRRSLRRWSTVEFPFTDPRNRVNDILPLQEDGEFWLGTDGGLVYHAGMGGIETITRIGGEELGAVTGLTRDSAGAVWVTSGASFEGAFRWANGRWDRYGPAQGFDVGRVHRVYVTGDSAVWFLSLGGGAPDGEGGVYRLHQGELEHIRDDAGWLDSRVYAMAEGISGTLWFGSLNGLARLSGGQWRHWGVREGLGGVAGVPRAFTLLPDEHGGVWVGFGPDSNLGLGIVDSEGSVSYLTTDHGLPGNAVSEIARDSQGVVWLSTNWGVARFETGEWTTFGGAAGLSPAKAWPLAFQGNNLFVGTTGGGLKVLDRREENNPPPQVSLQGPIVVDGKTVRVRWRALAYRGEMHPEEAAVRDRFDGGEWSEWGMYRELWTSEGDDLSWGRHRLEIQAKGLFGQFSEPLVAEFEIPYPMALRPLFYIPVLGSLLGLFLLALSWNRRRSQIAESALQSEARLRTLVDTAPDGITIYDASEDQFTDVNQNILRLTGLTREEFLGTRLGGTSPSSAPGGGSAREFLKERVREALVGKEVLFDWTSRTKSGELIPTEVRLVRLPSSMGKLVRFSVLDVRDRKAAESRREELEAQLRQSQKLEAVGQLTGGVAHDFNNLLTVILGNMDLLKEIRGDDPELLELAESAIGAAERSAVLTQRLLAFSRRQALHTKTIELPDLVDGLLNLLMRSLGERVRVRAEFPSDLWLLSADPGQLEHTLINLAVNARDAMPRGGELYLEAHNVVLEPEIAPGWSGEPGEYVCVSVTDTGIGMAPEVMERAIDPFFTTKEIGAGSGLGLSMVYGFMKQTGGFLQIHSQEGMGTAVQLFLPRAVEGEPSQEVGSAAPPHGGGEVVLVVEDEPLLLQLTTSLVKRLGYKAVEATDGPEALKILEGDEAIDVLFCDVVLPGGLDGVELAQAARKYRPELPVIFTSGYSHQYVVRLSGAFSDFLWVPKPFNLGSVGTTLRESLK